MALIRKPTSRTCSASWSISGLPPVSTSSCPGRGAPLIGSPRRSKLPHDGRPDRDLVELTRLAAGAQDSDVRARARWLSDWHHRDAAGSADPAERVDGPAV